MRLVRLFIVCSLILLSAVYSSKAVEIEKPKEKLSQEDIEKIRNFFKDHPFPDSAYNVEIKKAAMNNQKEIRVGFILVPNPDFFSLFEKIKPVDAEVLERLFISPLMGARSDGNYGYVFPFDMEFELKSQTGEILQRYTRPFEFAARGKHWPGYGVPYMNHCPDSSFTSCLALFGKTNVLVNPGEVDIPLSVDSQNIKDVSASVVTKRNKEEADKKIKEAQKKQEEQESLRREGERLRREREAEEEARRDTPEYKRGVIAEQLCQNINSLDEVNKSLQRSNKVDAASATVNLSERRQLASSKMYLEEEIEKLKKEYKKLGGREFSRKKNCE